MSEILTIAAPRGIKATRTGAELPDNLSYDEWVKVGEYLQTVQRSVLWWIGDWLNYGEKKYGETYAQAIELTGYEESTLKSAKWVADRIEKFRRRNFLSWAHHADVAGLDSEEQDRWLDEAERHRWSTRALRSAIKQSRLIQPGESDTCEVSDLYEVAKSGKKFGTIYADPPWEYDNRATRAAADGVYKDDDTTGKPTLTPQEIADLPIQQIAADRAHLHLWTTNAFLFDCQQIIKAWGFEYKSLFVWVKPQMGIGNYWRVSHELLLLGVRGGMTFEDKGLMSWLLAERGEHSVKPEKVRLLIEKASPPPRIELFARRCSEGWTAWGNEIERDLFTREVATL